MTQDPKILDLIAQMSAEQKVGAVLTLGFNGTLVTPNIIEYVERFHCGGLRLTPNMRNFGSYVDPESGKTVVKVDDNQFYYKKGILPPELSAAEYKGVLDSLQARARSRRLGLPLHFSCDQEGDGTEANCVFKEIRLFAKNMGIRATNDKRYAYETALATARQLRSIGYNYIHSPVVDISVNPANPEVYNRAYSDNAEEVAEWAIESCRGYRDGGVIATGKHFPGRGDSAVDAHFKIPEIPIDRETLERRELLPYRVLIKEGLLPSIMLAHSIFPCVDPGTIATVSRKITTDLLRDEMGFAGVITTDSMTMGGIAQKYGVPTACAMALDVGADLVLMKAQNSLVKDCFEEIFRWVDEGRLPEEKLNEKIYRVLKLKKDYGLFETESPRESLENVLSDEKIHHLAVEVAQKSIQPVRLDEGILPLPKDQPILVVEQVYTLANNVRTHPGMLFRRICDYNPQAVYLEVALRADAAETEKILTLCESYDTIVFTNNYGRGEGSNSVPLERVLQMPGKQIVVISNTPYALSIPPAARNVVMSIGYTKENMDAVAAYLFGEGPAEGVMPVANSVLG